MSNMIRPEVASANFQRLANLAGSLDDAEFRASYMAHHLRAFIADQIRGLRGDMSQKEFGQLIGKPQSVVSRLENEEYGRVSLQTLIEIAIKMNIAFVGRFVDFPTFLRITADFSANAVTPMAYSRDAMDAFISDEQRRQEPQGALEAFLRSSYEPQKEAVLGRVANLSTEPSQRLGATYDPLGFQAVGERDEPFSMSAGRQSQIGTLEAAA
jgi:transcriptional regulator with XRE-family HTH domain